MRRSPLEEGNLEAVHNGEGVAPKSQAKALQKQIREFEKLLGKKTLENEILQDAHKENPIKKVLT